MKILEINKFYFANGGADRHFLDLVDLLEANGNTVAVFSMAHPKNLESEWSRHFLSTAGYTSEYSLWQKIKGVVRMFYSFEAKRKINKLLDEFRPDIVHIHNIYHQLSPVILFEIKKRGIPIIMTIHDYKLISPNYILYHKGEIYDRCHGKKYYRCFLDKCVRDSYVASLLATLEAYWHEILGTYRKNVDLYISPSEFTRNILAKEWIANRKIVKLPHFIPEINNIKFSNSKEAYAVYFGKIGREKGIDDLIDIFENVRGLKLYLAGPISDGYVIKKSKNMRYLGQLGRCKLADAINNASIVVSASRLPETFGLIALEAISHGKPFIGFDTGAYSEIITNGKNGILVKNKNEFKSAINEILQGKILFDQNEILMQTGKYEKQKYYDNFIQLAKKILDY